MQRKRVIDRDNHQITEYTTINKFLSAGEISAGISTINHGGIPIDLLISPGSSSTTIFFFHGAVEDHFNIPVLSGMGISSGLDAHRVFISDPSLVLDERLMLSWYAGNVKQPDLQHDLVLIIEKIISDLASDRIVFFGGSGGGFASLFFASCFENSTALVFNPQTNIARYHENAVRDFLEKAFLVESATTESFQELPPTLVSNVCQQYNAPTNSVIVYMQNLNDYCHVEAHLNPFVENIHPETPMFLLKDYWEVGHSPPPRQLLLEVLQRVVESHDFSDDLRKLNFKTTAEA